MSKIVTKQKDLNFDRNKNFAEINTDVPASPS
jgi:hypothetical protein